MQFEGLPQAVKPGDSIYINDGTIQLEVGEVVGDQVRCRVVVGGELRSRKGVNFPGIDLGISAFTERDRQFLTFAADQKLDAVSQSFVQCGEDLEAVRGAAVEMGYHPLIIAKIERARAVENLDHILEHTDGIMVARGRYSVSKSHSSGSPSCRRKSSACESAQPADHHGHADAGIDGHQPPADTRSK